MNKINFLKIPLFFTFILNFLILISPLPSRSEVLFEGYSKVLIGGSHVGYFVNQYSFDSKKKTFSGIYLLKTNELGGSINESVKATSNEKLEPLSFQYTSVNGGKTKVIEGTFKKNKLNLKITDNGKVSKSTKNIEPGIFLSQFLGYVMLKSPQGMKTGTKYEYKAIAEEDGEITSGIAQIGEIEIFKGLKVYKILNEFKGVQFVSLVTEKGEALSTKSPSQAIETELVNNPKDAIKDFSFSEKNMTLLFGSVPKGITHSLYESTASAATTSTPLPTQTPSAIKEEKSQDSLKLNSNIPPSKQHGVPGGKGIQLKTGK